MSRSLLHKLYRLHLLSPGGIARFLHSLWCEGVNLMAVTRFAAHYYPSVLAVADEKQLYTYQALHTQAKTWAGVLYEQGWRRGMRCALLGRNSSEMVIASLALSRLGVHIYYMSTDLSKKQVRHLCQERRIATALVQEEYADRMPSELEVKLLEDLSECHESLRRGCIPKGRGGRIIVLTGGSSGHYKVAARKPSVTAFLHPFFALLREIRLDECRSVYIAPPLYHGFGLASLIVALVMGRSVYLRKRFDPQSATRLLSEYSIEVLIAVPLMLRRLINESPSEIRSLRRILSGGAPLDAPLVRAVEQHWGAVLYNLYGTSEAGFFILATPEILHNAPLALGKPIRGVRCKIVRPDRQGVGVLAVRSGWAMDDRKGSWQETGDLAWMDESGVLFLRGRADSMILSGGENAYPEVLREALVTLDAVKDVAVVAYPDLEFGTRLAAFVVLKEDRSSTSEEDLRLLLSAKLPRYQMPGRIIRLAALPRLENGKVAEGTLREIIKKTLQAEERYEDRA